MLHVIARIPVQAGRYDEVAAALVELARATRLEDGCLRYDVLGDRDALVFVTREEWRDAAAEQVHMRGPAVAAAFAAVGDALAAPPDILRLRPVSLS